MRKLLCCAAVLCLAAGALFAEPIILDQATNVLNPGTLELGLGNFGYQNDLTIFTDAAGVETSRMTTTDMTIPIFARYAFTPAIEASLAIPMLSRATKNEIGSASASSSDSGLGDITGKVKYNVLDEDWKVAVGGALQLPFGAKKFREGIDLEPAVMASRTLGDLIFNANLSYALTMEYDSDTTPSVKVNPADVLNIGAGIEYPVAAYEGLSLTGEFLLSSLSATSIGGTAQSGTAGSRMDLAVGARYNVSNFRTALGVALSLGEEKYRAYDYKILLGATYLLNI